MIQRLQHCLWVIGFLVLGYCGMSWMTARFHQSIGNSELDRLLTKRTPGVQHPSQRLSAPPHGGLVGRVEIPRLRLSAVIFEGTDEPVLSQGVGHLTGSALPGPAGNVVLAGHRDSFFRALRNIRKGDTVEVTTTQGSRSYTIETTRIIEPTEVSVLEPTRAPTLTLVTCYPFYYVGHAPERFIVRGVEIPEGNAVQAQIKSRREVIRAD